MHRAVPRWTRHRGCRLDDRGRLPAQWLIHTVGPNYAAGQRDRSLLASCYRRVLEVAVGTIADAVTRVSAARIVARDAAIVERVQAVIDQLG